MLLAMKAAATTGSRLHSSVVCIDMRWAGQQRNQAAKVALTDECELNVKVET